MDEQGMNEKNRAVCFLQQRPVNVFSRAFEKQNTYFETVHYLRRRAVRYDKYSSSPHHGVLLRHLRRVTTELLNANMLTLSVVEFEVTTVTEIVVQHSRSSSRASGVESPAVATPSKDRAGSDFDSRRGGRACRRPRRPWTTRVPTANRRKVL
ncbi:hypothetical protein HPB50_016800 [Hyalomma asiaticum]|uniref:Uncharacterized protein n=1 Tax=Hyalomma asiaticum TaxID=266040 RepID=A0ACB7SHS0_HYAAI|nr:hypothetical protein HPB50_016800 [Hyalomma asiaticum]